jgi:hypothetical protein
MERKKKIRLIIIILGSLSLIIYFLFFNKFICNGKLPDDPENSAGNNSEEILSKQLYTENAELITKWESDKMYYKLILKGKYVGLFKIPEDSIYAYKNLNITLIDKDNFAVQKINIIESDLVFDKTNQFMFYDGNIQMDAVTYQKLERLVIVHDNKLD